MDSKIIAFLPIRSGSKTIPNKNIKPIAGKPLWKWVADAAFGCELIDENYVAVDSDLYKQLIPFSIRVKEMDDKCMQESVMLDFANDYAFDHIILLQATSPLITSDDLTGGIKKYFDANYDSLISVTRQKKLVWQENGIPLNYDLQNRPRRQDWDGFLVENGCFFITSKEALLRSRCRISGKIGLYEMPESTYYEIDEPSDWIIVEELLKQRRENYGR